LSNVDRGRSFQLAVKDALERRSGIVFDLEVALPVGDPPKPHTFDFASPDKHYVGEAKAFTWTTTGNVPSAKITGLREALNYLRLLPSSTATFLVVKRDYHPRRRETLGEYFVRLNRNLLGNVAILELPEAGGELQLVWGTFPSR